MSFKLIKLIEYDISFVVGARLKDSGKMERDMDLELNTVGDGHTEGNGHKDSKDGMEYDRQPLPMPNTKEPGPTDCKTDTDRRLMLMEVRYFSK